MKVIVQQAVATQSHRNTLVCLNHEIHEGSVIVGLVKHLTSAVSAIQRVVNVASFRCSCGSGHGGSPANIRIGRQGSNNSDWHPPLKVECPLFTHLRYLPLHPRLRSFPPLHRTPHRTIGILSVVQDPRSGSRWRRSRSRDKHTTVSMSRGGKAAVTT